MVHISGVVHRDLKADNFLLDPVRHTFVLSDFGLSKIIKEDISQQPGGRNRGVGSKRYWSLWIEDGAEALRTDDVISAIYIGAEIQCGFLAWSESDKKHAERIKLKEEFEDMVIIWMM